MKTILIIGSALGLSASAAMADCAGHKPITAEIDVDRTIVTASVAAGDTMSASEEFLLLQKGARLAEESATATEVE